MFGIKYKGYFITKIDNKWSWGRPYNLILSENPTEIDQLHQDFMSRTGHYDAVVYKLTDEEIAEITIRKLKGC